MSVRRCQQEVDAREFVEWQVLLKLEPWGERRGDVQAGIVAATLANIHKPRGTRPFVPGDFLPIFGPRASRPEQTPAQMMGIFRQIAAATGQRTDHGTL